MLYLIDGMVTEGAEYAKPTDDDVVTVRWSGNHIVPPIRIAPRGLWPTLITRTATEPIPLGIEIVYKPGDRQPRAIQWLINNILKGIRKSVADYESNSGFFAFMG